MSLEGIRQDIVSKIQNALQDNNDQQVIKCIEYLNGLYDQVADKMSVDDITALLKVILFMKYDQASIQEKTSLFIQKMINSDQYLANQAQQSQSSLSNSKNFNEFFNYINSESLSNVYSNEMEMIIINYISLLLPNSAQLLEYQGFKIFIERIIDNFQFQDLQIYILQERQEIILSYFNGQLQDYVKYLIKNLTIENVKMDSLIQLLAYVIKHPSSDEAISVILKYIYMFDETLINKFNKLSIEQLGIIKQAIQLSLKYNTLQNDYLLFVYKLTKIKVHIFFIDNMQISVETLTQQTKQVYCIIENLLLHNIYDYFGNMSVDVIVKYFGVVNKIFELLQSSIDSFDKQQNNSGISVQNLNLIRLKYLMLVQKYLKQTFKVFKANLTEINKKQEYREIYIMANQLQSFLQSILSYTGIASVLSLQFVIDSIIDIYSNLNISIALGLYMLNHVYHHDLLGQLEFYEQFQEYDVINKILEIIIEYFVKNSGQNLISILHYCLSEVYILNENPQSEIQGETKQFDLHGLMNLLNIIYNQMHTYIDVAQLKYLSETSIIQFNLIVTYIFNLVNSPNIQMNMRLLLNKLIIKLIDQTQLQLLSPQVTQLMVTNVLNDVQFVLGQNNYCQFNLENLKLSDNTQLRPLTIQICGDEYKNILSFRDRINDIIGSQQYEYLPISLETISYILWQLIQHQIENNCLNTEILYAYAELLPVLLTGRNINLRYYTLYQLSQINKTSTHVLLYLQSHKQIELIILGLKHQVQLGALQNEINTRQTIQITRVIQKQQHVQQGSQQDISSIYIANQQQMVYLTLQQLLYNDKLENTMPKSYLLNSVYFTNNMSIPTTYNQFKYLHELSEKPLQMQAIFLQNQHTLNFVNLSQLTYQILGRLGQVADIIQAQQQIYQFKDSNQFDKIQFLKISKTNDGDSFMNYSISPSKQVEFEVQIQNIQVIQSFSYFFSQQLYYHELDDDLIRKEQISHYCKQVKTLLQTVFSQELSKEDDDYIFNSVILMLYYCIFKRYQSNSEVLDELLQQNVNQLQRIVKILFRIAISDIKDDYICYARHVTQKAVEVCLFVVKKYEINLNDILSSILNIIQLQQHKIIQFLLIINYYQANNVEILINLQQIKQYTLTNLNEALDDFTVRSNFAKVTQYLIQKHQGSTLIETRLQKLVSGVHEAANLEQTYSNALQYVQMYRYVLNNLGEIADKQLIAVIEKKIVSCLNNNKSKEIVILLVSHLQLQNVLELINKVNDESVYNNLFNTMNCIYCSHENLQFEAPYEIITQYISKEFESQMINVESIKIALSTINFSQIVKDENEFLMNLTSYTGIKHLGNNMEAFYKETTSVINSFFHPVSEQNQKSKRGTKKQDLPKETSVGQVVLYLNLLVQSGTQDIEIVRQYLQQFMLLSQNNIEVQLNLQYAIDPEYLMYYILDSQYLDHDPNKIRESLTMLKNLLQVYPLLENIEVKNLVVKQTDQVYSILNQLSENKALQCQEQKPFKQLLFEFVFMSIIQHKQEEIGEILNDINTESSEEAEHEIYKILYDRYGYDEGELSSMRLIYLHKSYKFQEFDQYLGQLIKNDKIKLFQVNDLAQLVSNLKECCQNNGILYCAKILNEINKKIWDKSNENLKYIFSIFDTSRYYLEQIVEQQKNAVLYNSQQEFTETNLATIATTTALTYKQEGDQEIIDAVLTILNTSQYYEHPLIYNKIITLLNNLLLICDNQLYSQKSHIKQPSLRISMIIGIILYVLIVIGEKQNQHGENNIEELRIANSYQESLIEMLIGIIEKYPEDMIQLTYKSKVISSTQSESVYHEFNIPQLFQSKKEHIKSPRAKSAFIKMFATHGIEIDMLQISELTYENMIPDVKCTLHQQTIYQQYRTKLIISLIKSYFNILNSMLNIYNISLCLTHFYANQEEYQSGETLFLQTFQNIGDHQPQEDQFNNMMKQLHQQISIFVQLSETIKHSVNILLDLWKNDYKLEHTILEFTTQICFLFLNFMPPCFIEPSKVLLMSDRHKYQSNEIRIGNTIFKDFLSNNPTSNMINVYVSSLLAVHDSTGQLLEFNVGNQLNSGVDNTNSDEQLNYHLLGEFLGTELLQSLRKFEAPPYTGLLKERIADYVHALQYIDVKNMKISKVTLKTSSGIDKEVFVSSDSDILVHIRQNFSIVSDLEAMVPYNFSLSGMYLTGYLQNAYFYVLQNISEEATKKLISKANSRVNQWELLNNVSHYRNPLINEQLCQNIEKIHQNFHKDAKKQVTLRLGTNQVSMKTCIKQVVQCLGDPEIYRHFITQKRPAQVTPQEFQQKTEKLTKDFQARLTVMQKLYQGESNAQSADADIIMPFSELLELLHTGQIQYGQKQNVHCVVACLFTLRHCQKDEQFNSATAHVVLRALQLNSDFCAFIYLKLMENIFSKVQRLNKEQIEIINSKVDNQLDCTYGPYMHAFQVSEQNQNILQIQKTLLIMLQSTSQTVIAQRINLHVLNTKALINDNIFGFDNYTLVQLADNYQNKLYSSETTHQAIIQQIKSTFSNNKDLGFTKRWLYNFAHHLPAMSPAMHLAFEGAPDQVGYENVMLISRLFYKNQAHTEARDFGLQGAQASNRATQPNTTKERSKVPRIQEQIKDLFKTLGRAYNLLNGSTHELQKDIHMDKLITQKLITASNDEALLQEINEFIQPQRISHGVAAAAYYEGFVVLSILYQNLYEYILATLSGMKLNEQIKSNIEGFKAQISECENQISKYEGENKKMQKDLKDLENSYKTYQNEQHKKQIEFSSDRAQSSSNQSTAEIDQKIRKLREQNEQLTREQAQCSKRLEKCYLEKFMRQYELIKGLQTYLQSQQARDRVSQPCDAFYELYRCYEQHYKLSVEENQMINHQFQCEKIAQRVLLGLYEQLGEDAAAFGLLYPINIRTIDGRQFAVSVQGAPKRLYEVNAEFAVKDSHGTSSASAATNTGVAWTSVGRLTLWHDVATPISEQLPGSHLGALPIVPGGFTRNRGWFGFCALAGDVMNFVLNESFLRSQPTADFFTFAFQQLCGLNQNAINRLQKAEISNSIIQDTSINADEIVASVQDRTRKAVRRLCIQIIRTISKGNEAFQKSSLAIRAAPLLEAQTGRPRSDAVREMHKAESSRALLILLERETFQNQTFKKLLENLLEAQQLQEIDQIAKDLRDEYIKKQYKEAQPNNQFRQQISRFKLFMDVMIQKVKELNMVLFPLRQGVQKPSADEWLSRLCALIEPQAVAELGGGTMSQQFNTLGQQNGQNIANQLQQTNQVQQQQQLNNSSICEAIALMNSAFPGYRVEFSGIYLPGNAVYSSILNNVIENEEVRSVSDDFTSMYTRLYTSPSIDYDDQVDYRLSRKIFEQFSMLSSISPEIGVETVLKLGLLKRSAGSAILAEKKQDDRFSAFSPGGRLSCGDIAFMAPILIFQQQKFAPSAAAPGVSGKFISEGERNRFKDFELIGYESYIQQLESLLASFEARSSAICGETIFKLMRNSPHARLEESFQGAAALTAQRLESLFLLCHFALLRPAENDGLIQKLLLLIRDGISSAYNRKLLSSTAKAAYSQYWTLHTVFKAQRDVLQMVRSLVESGAAPEHIAQRIEEMIFPIIEAFQAQNGLRNDGAITNSWNNYQNNKSIQYIHRWNQQSHCQYKYINNTIIINSGRNQTWDSVRKMLLINCLQTCLCVPGGYGAFQITSGRGRSGKPQLTESELLTGEYGVMKTVWKIIRPKLAAFRLNTVNDIMRHSIYSGNPFGAYRFGAESSLESWEKTWENRDALLERKILLQQASMLYGGIETSLKHSGEVDKLLAEMQGSTEGNEKISSKKGKTATLPEIKEIQNQLSEASQSKIALLNAQSVAVRVGQLKYINQTIIQQLLTEKTQLNQSQIFFLSHVIDVSLDAMLKQKSMETKVFSQQLSIFTDLLFVQLQSNSISSQIAFGKFIDCFLLPNQILLQKINSNVGEMTVADALLNRYIKIAWQVDKELIYSQINLIMTVLCQKVNNSIVLQIFMATLVLKSVTGQNCDWMSLLSLLCALTTFSGIKMVKNKHNNQLEVSEAEFNRFVYDNHQIPQKFSFSVIQSTTTAFWTEIFQKTQQKTINSSLNFMNSVFMMSQSEKTGNNKISSEAASKIIKFFVIHILLAAQPLLEMMTEMNEIVEIYKPRKLDLLVGIVKQLKTLQTIRPLSNDEIEIIKNALDDALKGTKNLPETEKHADISIKGLEKTLNALEKLQVACDIQNTLSTPLTLSIYEDDIVPCSLNQSCLNAFETCISNQKVLKFQENNQNKAQTDATIRSSVGPQTIPYVVVRRKVRYVITQQNINYVQNYPVLLLEIQNDNEKRNVFLIPIGTEVENTVCSAPQTNQGTAGTSIDQLWENIFPNATAIAITANCLANNAISNIFGAESRYKVFSYGGNVIRYDNRPRKITLKEIHQLQAQNYDFCHLFVVQKRLSQEIARLMIKSEIFGLRPEGNNVLQNFCYKQSFDINTGEIFELFNDFQLPLTQIQLQQQIKHFVSMINGIYSTDISFGTQKNQKFIIDKITVQKLHPHIILGYVPQALGVFLKNLAVGAAVRPGLDSRFHCSYDQTQVCTGCVDVDSAGMLWERIQTAFYFQALLCQNKNLELNGQINLATVRNMIYNALQANSRILDVLADKQDERRLMRLFGLSLLVQQIQRAYMPFAVEWVAYCISAQWG